MTGKTIVESVGLTGAEVHVNGNSGIPQTLDAPSADFRIGVDGRDDDMGDSGLNEGISARTGTAGVGARLERNVGGGAPGGLAGLLQCHDLGVVASIVLLIAFADDHSFFDENTAYDRIRRGQPDGLAGKIERPAHPALVRRW